MKQKNSILLLSLAVFTLALAGGCTKKSENAAPAAPTPAAAQTAAAGTPAAGAQTPGGQPMTAQAPDLTTDENGLSKATVTITTTKGVIKYKFYPKDAPNTVNRIAELIGQGFYNGLTFHRVVPNFVIQGGDPTGTGMGGTGQKLKAEFNNRRHVEGAVAMARAQDPNSADCQFYITLAPTPHLDRNYTVFGLVVEGMDVVKKIAVGDRMTSVTISN